MFSIYVRSKFTIMSDYHCSNFDDLHLLVRLLESNDNIISYTITRYSHEYTTKLWDVYKYVSFSEWSKQ
jgi:hypothetical protein